MVMNLTLIRGDLMTICSVPECDRNARAKGMCPLHYEKVRRNGTIEPKRFQDPHAGTGRKTCRICWEVKDVGEFVVHPKMKDGHANQCKACRNEINRLRYNADPEHRKRIAWNQRKNRYGIDQDGFAKLLASQGGGCAICKTTTPPGRGWVVDHRSGTNVARGILCHPCNVFIGLAGEDVARLGAAIAYLTRPLPQSIEETA